MISIKAGDYLERIRGSRFLLQDDNWLEIGQYIRVVEVVDILEYHDPQWRLKISYNGIKQTHSKGDVYTLISEYWRKRTPKHAMSARDLYDLY